MKAMSNLQYALKYHTLGWSVIPLKPGTKEPHSKLLPKKKEYPELFPDLTDEEAKKSTWKPYQFQRASEEQVREWWSNDPDAGIGLVLGQVSGVVALDLDGEGAEQLTKENGLTIPPTTCTRTGSGGLHYLFRCTEALATTTTLLKGDDCHIELRAEGSYIVLPPSLHPLGSCYEELIPAEDIIDLPGHIRAMATSAEEQDAAVLDFPIDKLPEHFEKLLTADAQLRELWEEAAPDGDQSARDYALACRCLEEGLTHEEVATVLWDAPHGKRRRDDRKPDYVQSTVARAAQDVAKNVTQERAPQIHLTDTGNAERLVAEHGEDIRYCWPWKKWLVWDGQVWRAGAEAEVLQMAKRTLRKIYRDANRIEDDDKRQKLIKHALSSESAQRRRAMTVLSQSEEKVACDHTIFDTAPWLLNCQNGTLDLRNGNLRPHCREDYITRITPVEFDVAAQCPKWLKFLDGVFAGNTQLIQFVQRAAGYSLTGDVSEDALFFLHGTGANGKTTLFLTLQELLGPYAIGVSPGLLLTHRYETHPTGLADLFGVRLAVSVEVGEGRRFDEERLKQITGGDRIRARRMREDFWEFPATHKIWLAANEKPKVAGQDYAIWRRIQMIPFNVKFTDPGGPGPDKDVSLRKTLFRDERPGILTWALVGCISWQADGLAPPTEVQNATAQYRTEEDVIQQFIDAECGVGSDMRENPTELFKAYERWRRETGATKLSQTAFGRRLTEKGFKSDRDAKGRWRVGIALIKRPQLGWEE